MNTNGVPEVAVDIAESEGALIFSPPGMIHEMGNLTNAPLVTAHFYFPPITRMKVFDIAGRRAAVVADDCGAWWPEGGQLLSMAALSRNVDE
jgi:cysteine dioxygenase